MKPLRATFANRRWTVRDIGRALPGQLGGCDYEAREIRVPMDGDTLEELDTIFHEGLHAACPWMSEEAVEEAAHDLAVYVWSLDWRKDYP